MKQPIAFLLIASALNAPTVRATEDSSVAAIVTALKERLTKCWIPPHAARNLKLTVKVHFLLNADGTVQSLPKVLNASDHPLFASVKGAAVRAVVDCQPYDLPAGKYDLWRDNTIDFNTGMKPPDP